MLLSISRLSVFFFFFSSRRRHTRFDCDWSSDVCSSDLPPRLTRLVRAPAADLRHGLGGVGSAPRRRDRSRLRRGGGRRGRRVAGVVGRVLAGALPAGASRSPPPGRGGLWAPASLFRGGGGSRAAG